MSGGLDESPGKGDGAEPELVKTSQAAEESATLGDPSQPQAADAAPSSVKMVKRGVTAGLPLPEAPKLAAGQSPPDAEAPDDPPHEPAGDSSTSAPRARVSRFALLAATIALAAAVGSLVGSLGASGIARLLPAGGAGSGTVDARSLLRATKLELAELSALKANVDSATRNANTQFVKIAGRLDRVERGQADPAAKLAHIAETVDRLSKRPAVVADITGSIAPNSPPAAGSDVNTPVLRDWIVQNVRHGRALVESRYGGLYDVGAGSVLPRIGRVETIKRQNGQWMVITARGVITSMP
jgi:hypothetical protein